MDGRVYYNEIDPFAVAWLAELMRDGLIPRGEIDTRSIRDVHPGDLTGFVQCHFFAGIAGWAYALELAGWPSDRPVWTGSCPCQPFSAAGKRKGVEDERHLWPEFRRLITECNPPTVFGEQVASKDGRIWLSGVRADLEALGYAVGAADLCAAGIGAPHIRQRLFWVADANEGQRGRQPNGEGRIEHRQTGGWLESHSQFESGCDIGGLHDTASTRQQPAWQEPEGEARDEARLRGFERRCHQGWGSTWIDCADGKARRIEPSIQPLAHGVPNRVGTLRGAGNAIVPQVAAEFIAAIIDTEFAEG